jgi:type IV pilus assembly protein PilM
MNKTIGSIISRLRGETTTVGLDIGNHSVKLVKILHRRSGPVLTAAGIHELKPDTIVGGEIRNKDALIEALTTLVNQTDSTIKDVVMSLSWSYGVLGDRINLKSQRGSNDEETILFEAGQRPPFDVENITLDYKVLRRNVEASEMEVLLVAAKNQVMQSYIDIVYEAGLRPIVIDVDAFAFANAYSWVAGTQNPDEIVALINIGDNLTNITFLKGGIYHSTRDVSTAGDYFVKYLMRQFKVNREEATGILKGKNLEKYDPAQVERAIEFSCEELSLGIDLAFQYFQSSEKGAQIHKIILCGGGACIANVPELIGKKHEAQVNVLNPLASIAKDEEKFPNPLPDTVSTLLTVATGMALRKV